MASWTSDVPAYALVFGVPGVIRGWVSRAGHRLELDGEHVARCPEDGSRNRLVDGGWVDVLED